MHCLAIWMNFLDRWTKKGQQVLAFKSFLYYWISNLMIGVEKMNWFLQGGIEGSCRLLLASEFCVSKCNCGKVLSGNFLRLGIPEFCISVMTFCGWININYYFIQLIRSACIHASSNKIYIWIQFQYLGKWQ